MNDNVLRPRTVKLIKRFVTPLVEEGLISVPEEKFIFDNLKHLAKTGTLKPIVIPKLIDMRESSQLIGVSYSNFKRLEAEAAFPFKRKLIGSSVRFRNTDIIDYIMSDD
jgi:predicted DNA-binding transcriptional regulator AlpA